MSPDLSRQVNSVRRDQLRWGRLANVGVLLLTVLVYSGCPLAVAWSKVVGFVDTPEGLVPIRGRPYSEASVIVVSWTLVGITGLLCSAARGGRRAVRSCLDPGAILRIAPAGAGWALADVCEVLALAHLDPASYGVISQARLLGSASACRFMLGLKQTGLQWRILCVLSLTCAAYCMLPEDDLVTEEDRHGEAEFQLSCGYCAGVVLALAKVALSVFSGVYGEVCFKKPAEASGAGTRPAVSAPAPELCVQMTRASISSVLAAYIGYLVVCLLQGEQPADFFSGLDGTWDVRTVCVAVLYAAREWICNLCVKRYDSLAKNICNAIALVMTYWFAVTVTGEAGFAPLKVALLLAIVVEVVNYSRTRQRGGDPRSEAGKACFGGSVAGIVASAADRVREGAGQHLHQHRGHLERALQNFVLAPGSRQRCATQASRFAWIFARTGPPRLAVPGRK